MSDVTVSVIMPVRNCATTVEETLKSILSQRNVEFELIVVDGHSNDGTSEMVKKLLRNSDYYELQNGQGLYAAINKGISLASGQWIYIIGGDDRLRNDNVLSLLTQNVSRDILLVYGDVMYHGNSSSWVRNHHISSFGWGLIWRNTLHQQSVLYRRELFKDFMFHQGFNVLSDYAFHLRLFIQKYVHIRNSAYRPMIIASCGANGLSKRFTVDLYKEELKVRKFAMPFWLFFLTAPWVFIKCFLKVSLFKRGVPNQEVR